MEEKLNLDCCVDVHDLTVAYNRKPVLWDIDLQLPTGKLVAIVGPNGAGKSTLLKSILGLTSISSGSITVFSEECKKARSKIGYVPQRESVDWDFPINVLDVVVMGRYRKLGWFVRPSDQDRTAAKAALEQVGILELASRQISELSGGQQQRVFLARALVQEANLYLMDEPFAGVDSATERSIIDVLRKIRDQGRSVIAVHHDLQTIPDYFDWVVMLNLNLVASGPVVEVFTAENLQRTYGGRLTILDRVSEAVRLGVQRGKQDTTQGI